MNDAPLIGRYDGDDIPLWKAIPRPVRRNILLGGQFTLIALSLLVILFPLFWMASSALRPANQILNIPTPLLPPDVTLDNFIEVITQTNFLTWLWNSVVVSLGVVVLTTATATLAGYGLTRIDIPFKRTVARTVLFGYMFPPILLGIPMFIFWRQLGWINSKIGLILAITATALPFAIWLMWKFFQTVPISLEESAQMAGASRFRAFYEIAIPLSKPGMIAIAVFSFAISWNAFTLPAVLMIDNNQWVLTQGLFSFTQNNTVFWELLMAASTMTVLPPLVFVYFLQKHLLRGFRLS